MVAGSIAALATYLLYKAGTVGFGSDLAEAFWGAFLAFAVDAVVSVVVTFFTEPRPVEELDGLVHGRVAQPDKRLPGEDAWFRRPGLLGVTVLGLTVLMSVFFI
jgi:SSS family solute:Na+ symporter